MLLVRLQTAALVAALLVLPGCGGDGADETVGAPDSPGVEAAAPAAIPTPPPARNALAADAEAKSNARNLVSHVESCFAETQDYTGCDTEVELGTTGLAIGLGPGQVQVASASAEGYSVVSRSVTGTTFSIRKGANALVRRTCSSAGTGGCGPDGTW